MTWQPPNRQSNKEQPYQAPVVGVRLFAGAGLSSRLKRPGPMASMFMALAAEWFCRWTRSAFLPAIMLLIRALGCRPKPGTRVALRDIPQPGCLTSS